MNIKYLLLKGCYDNDKIIVAYGDLDSIYYPNISRDYFLYDTFKELFEKYKEFPRKVMCNLDPKWYLKEEEKIILDNFYNIYKDLL